jgi:methyl-accepting chemotaxis protein
MSHANMSEILGAVHSKAGEVVTEVDAMAINVRIAGAMTSQVGASIREALSEARETRELVGRAQQTAAAAAQQVSDLSRTGEEIGKVMGLIRDVARQTNMLALNAKIEAARAGDAGRGFSVVAEEVKGLAAQVAKATGRISTLLADVIGGSTMAKQAMDHLKSDMLMVDGLIETLVTAVSEQGDQAALAANHIGDAVQSSEHLTSALASVEQLTADALTIYQTPAD